MRAEVDRNPTLFADRVKFTWWKVCSFIFCICFSVFVCTQVHQEEFKGDAPSFVESSFSFDASQAPGEFYIYIPNPFDPKVNKVELTSPSGTRYTDQLSLLHDINVIKIDAVIDQPGKTEKELWIKSHNEYDGKKWKRLEIVKKQKVENVKSRQLFLSRFPPCSASLVVVLLLSIW